MRHLGYFAMLGFTMVGSFWLEVVLRVGVLRQVRRWLLTILPVALVFLLWDAYAIDRGHWFFDKRQIVGLYTPGRIPIEEVLFFIIVPLAALMTLQAVKSVKRDWVIDLKGEQRGATR